MTPRAQEVCQPSNEKSITPLRDFERPVWSRNGTLQQKPSVRHYIPKHPFYYTSQELYSTQHKTRADYEKETNRFVSNTMKHTGDARRAFSAPIPTRSDERLPPLSSTSRTKSTKQVRPENIPWVSTPVPGMRTMPQYDLYRRAALDKKNNLYHIESGLLPKYMGYVPGLKFRYGSTFGHLTFNAKEVGVERSPTWGGAVSII